MSDHSIAGGAFAGGCELGRARRREGARRGSDGKLLARREWHVAFIQDINRPGRLAELLLVELPLLARKTMTKARCVSGLLPPVNGTTVELRDVTPPIAASPSSVTLSDPFEERRLRG